MMRGRMHVLLLWGLASVLAEMATGPSACGVKLPSACSCSSSERGISFSCHDALLSSVPKIDVGPKVIQTLNLGKNRLTTINMGDFFGLKISRLLISNNSLADLPLLAFWGLEYNLETLDLSFNKLRVVPSDALKLLRNLQMLSLTSNRITILRHYDFGYLRRLEVLSLDSNPIHSVVPTAFLGTQLFLLNLDHIALQQGLRQMPTDSLQVRRLSLSKNALSFIPSQWFRNLTSLQYLRMDHNSIEFVTNETFVGIERSLRTLDLSSNKLPYIPVAILRKLSNLESLSLASNRLRRVFTRSFNNSRLLHSLDLSSNFISQISVFAFIGLDNVQRIDLRGNQLTTLDDRILYWPQPAGKQIFLSHNPWICNCIIKWMKQDYKKMNARHKLIADAHDLLCDLPRFLSKVAIMRIRLKGFTCDHNYFEYYYADDYSDSKDFSMENDVIEMDEDRTENEVDEELNDDSGSASGSGFIDDEDSEVGSSDDYDDEITVRQF